MSTFVIGDIQGCFDELEKLLFRAKFNPNKDTLWCLGDIINRGPKSLATLEYLYNLPNCHVTLGNHDFHLLAAYYTGFPVRKSDTLDEILNSAKVDVLCAWLRQQPLIYYNSDFNVILSHAGIYPRWDIEQAKQFADEVESTLQHGDYKSLLANMYGNTPTAWDTSLQGIERQRFIINCFTRMRFVSENGELDFNNSGIIEDAPKGYKPWFQINNTNLAKTKVLFGHWAALNGETSSSLHVCLDTGCVWDHALTMLELDNNRYFTVNKIVV